jgi:hypothetical protein
LSAKFRIQRVPCRRETDAPVVSGDENGAGSGLLAGVDLVGGLDALPLVGGSELLGEVVVSDGTDVGDRSGRADVLLRHEFIQGQ